MNPTNFPQANAAFRAPDGYDESQVKTVQAFMSELAGGNLDGDKIVVVAWLPSATERLEILAGAPIFLTCIGGLPPHRLSTTFQDATAISR